MNGDKINICDCRRKSNYAQKINATSKYINARQSHHILECQAEGDKTVNPTGTKKFPTHAATSVRLAGTLEGEQMFPQDEYMKANPSGFPTFKRAEWLSRDQLKSYMSKPRSALMASYTTLKEKEENNKLKAISDLNVIAVNELMKIEEPEKYHVTIENKDWKVPQLRECLRQLDPKMRLSGILKSGLQDLLIDALRVERLRRENDADNIVDDVNDMSLDEIILDDNESDNYKRLFAKKLFTA
jgi:hypothetical protein